MCGCGSRVVAKLLPQERSHAAEPELVERLHRALEEAEWDRQPAQEAVVVGRPLRARRLPEACPYVEIERGEDECADQPRHPLVERACRHELLVRLRRDPA